MPHAPISQEPDNRPSTVESATQSSSSDELIGAHLERDQHDEEDPKPLLRATPSGQQEAGEGQVGDDRQEGGQEEKEAQPLRGLNKLQSLNMLIMMFWMGCQLTLPYTLSVFMVRDFYQDKGGSEQLIAQLTGLLAATQSFARSLTSLPWGILSDIVGRKVCIIAGTVASLVSIWGYGSSTTYVGALLSRALPALFVGSPVALKSMMGDVCDQTGQAKAMAVFALGHGMGSVVGPVLGGLLSYPCRLSGMPGCSTGGIFQARPFLLPCLSASLFGLVALACNIFLLEETHPDLKFPGGWQANLARIVMCRAARPAVDEVEEGGPLHSRSSDVEMGRTGKDRRAESPKAQPSLPAHPETKQGTPRPAAEEVRGEEEDDESAGLLGNRGGQSSEDEHDEADKAEEQATEYRWWKDRDVGLALVGSGLIAFIFNNLDELAPIFVSAPVKQGGINMSLESFTWPISCGGVALVLFSLTLYPRLVTGFGALTLCRIGLLAGIPSTILLPSASLFPKSYVLQQAAVYASIVLKSPAKVCALNSSMIIVNMVAGKKQMGRINGAAMTLQSAGRALGPLISGSVWALAVSLPFKGHQFIGFVLIAVVMAVTQLLYLRLRLPSSK